MAFVNLQNIEEKEILPGIIGRFIHTDVMTVGYFNIKAGSILPPHQHIHEQISTVISGEFEMTLGGTVSILKQGQVAVIPSNTVHSGHAITDCMIIDVFNPTRDDYR